MSWDKHDDNTASITEILQPPMMESVESLELHLALSKQHMDLFQLGQGPRGRALPTLKDVLEKMFSTWMDLH